MLDFTFAALAAANQRYSSMEISMSIHRALAITLVSLPCLLAGCQGTPSGPKVQASSNPWFIAASSGSQADLNAAVTSNSNVNVHETNELYTPLHTAGMAGNVDAVKFILANGGNVDAVDEDCRTALMMSLYHRQGAAAVALINANANLELGDREGKTALMFAAQRGQVDAINAMIARNVNLNTRRRSGATALIFAADSGHLEAVRVLKAAGADTTIADKRGRTALDFAIARNNPEIVKALRSE